MLGGLISLALGACIYSVVQGMRVRRSVPRLPLAEGDAFGCTGEGSRQIRLLVVGDSSAVGMGVARFSESLAPRIAAQYSQLADCSTHWFVYGKSGATAEDLCRLLSAQPRGALTADVVVVAIGVNDVLRLRSHWRWRRGLAALLKILRAESGCRLVLVSPLPPLWKFRSLPVPLRLLLGLHAMTLNQVSHLWARRSTGVIHMHIPLPDPRAMLGSDGFHPSAAGYAQWASCVVAAMLRHDWLSGTASSVHDDSMRRLRVQAQDVMAAVRESNDNRICSTR